METKITSAAEAQRMLDDGRWDYDDSAADCARSVIAQHEATARLAAELATAQGECERLRAALAEAPAWGLMPNLAAVDAHAATQTTPHRGAPWMRRHSDSSGDFVDIFYLRVDRGRVIWRGPSGAVWYPASGLMLTSQWRPVTSDGTAAQIVGEGGLVVACEAKGGAR